MKLLNVRTTEFGSGKQSSMASSIINTMHVYFQSDKRKMGDLEHSIMNSVKRYFEKQPPPNESA
jgi:hypothetical protein